MVEGKERIRVHIPRRQRLIEVGIDLFSHSSYEEVSIDDIAEVAGISKGLLYYYYPTKHDFYVAVVQHAAQQLLRETEPDPQLAPFERLRTSLNGYFSYVERHAKAYVALLRGGVGADAEMAAIVDAVRRTYVERIIQYFTTEATLSPMQHIAIHGWVGFVETICIAWLEHRECSQEELCRLALETFSIVLRG